ncbi:MAG: winged helix-turn-helix domain-containing protein [Chloroflexi bacterium]|nr:winged helix-turn-helix domain-containing protein [Chloroflexota bacterium]
MTLPTPREIELPLLQEIMAAGGEARPSVIYPRMRKHFPAITDADMQLRLQTGGSVWTNRIQWVRQHLVLKGDMYREPRGLWRITPKGAARARGETPRADVIGPDAPMEAESVPFPSPLTVVSDPVDALCERLLTTQKQSSTPRNFEAALAEAFRFLGFDVQEQGKAGETDVLLDTHIGPDSYRVVVDAKATHGDKVGDNQINWLAINQHQRQAEADYAAVLGIGFRGGNLLKWADEYQTALVTTADLVDVLRMHRRCRFTLPDLRPLFGTPDPAQQSLQDLKTRFEAMMRHWQLLVEVVEVIDSFNRFNRSGLPRRRRASS